MNEQDKNFIEKQEKWIEAYSISIQKIEKEIEIILNGQPEKFIKGNGFPGFHSEIEKINALRFEQEKLQSRIEQAKETIERLKF
jgi:hypothetical protein